MVFGKKDKLPVPKAEESREEKIRKLKEELDFIERSIKPNSQKAEESQQLHTLSEEIPLPPKFEPEKQDRKVEIVPITWEELVSAQYDSIKTGLDKIIKILEEK